MINEISPNDVGAVIQYDGGSVEEVSQEIQQPNQNSINNPAIVQKKLFYEMAELLSSSAFGAGVGYLAGGMIKAIVDLAKNGITVVQKKSQEEGLQENTSRYIGINEFTITGISLGSTIGMITYLFVSELIKQKKEREAELRAVRDNIAENDNFNGALERQGVINNHQGQGEIANGVANDDYQIRLVGADITVNGDARNDLNRNPRNMMAVGEGNLNNVNAVSIFQSRQPREGSLAPLPKEELQFNEIKKNSKRRLQPNAKEFIKTGGYNLQKESPNLVLVRRDQEYQKQIEETTKQEDDGVGAFSARRNKSPRPSIEQGRIISTPNPEQEIQSAYASALESLKSPRGNVRSSQAREMHCDIDELMRSQPVFRAVKAFKQNPPQDKSRAR
jgi:hypothetical protein